MNMKNFFMAALLTGGVIFSGCTDKSVATTDQYPEDTGTTAEQYPGDDTQTTTEDGVDTGVAGTDTDTGMDQGVEGGVTTDTGMEREDVAASGEELEMDRMGNTGMDDAAMASMPAATQQLMGPIMDMMQQMGSQEMSGNIDQDFAKMMITHHQGAINLSDQVMQSGDNSEIIERARMVSQTKQQEIEQLQAHAGSDTNTGGVNDQSGMNDQTANNQQQMGAGGDVSEQLRSATEGTLNQLQSAGLNGDPDHDYAHLLILHHQDAVEMAEVQVQHGQNEELKALAQQIIDNNQQEISELETWVSSNDQ